MWRSGIRVEDRRFDIWDWELGIRDRDLDWRSRSGIEIRIGD